mgnify:CR=1 FL=1
MEYKYIVVDIYRSNFHSLFWKAHFQLKKLIDYIANLSVSPDEMNPILEIAKAHDLLVIEDAAQSPGVKYHDIYTGCLGDMGVHSLNNHKIIQTGEGGIITTKTSDRNIRPR